MPALRRYLAALAGGRHLLAVLYSPFLQFACVNAGLALLAWLCVGLRDSLEIGDIDGRVALLVVALTIVVQALGVMRLLGGYYSRSRLDHLRLYRVGDAAIMWVGLLQTAPLGLPVGAQCTALCALFSDGAYAFTVGAVSVLLLVVAVLAYLFALLQGRGRETGRRKAPITSRMAASLLRSGDGALLFRDIMTVQRSSLYLELPVMLGFSVAVSFLGRYVGQASGLLLPEACILYLSYVLVIQPVLVFSMRNEYPETQFFHLRLYRLFPNRLRKAIMQRVVLYALVVLLVHCAVGTICLGASGPSILADALAMLVACVVAEAMTWFYLWLLLRGWHVDMLVEMLSGLVFTLFPLALVFGALSRRWVVREGDVLA